jgi:hypothetical protein
MADEPLLGLAVKIVAILLASSLFACARSAAQADTAALLVDPTAESRAELLAAVREALHGAPVLLADDALTSTSVLTIERGAAADPQRRIATGRTLEPPEQFRLVINDSRCVLVHAAAGGRRVLQTARCAPEPRASH